MTSNMWSRSENPSCVNEPLIATSFYSFAHVLGPSNSIIFLLIPAHTTSFLYVLTATGRSYIVVFKDSTAAHVIEKAENDILDLGGKIGQRYTTVLKGFSAWMPGHIYTALSTNPFIDYIEEDGEGKVECTEHLALSLHQSCQSNRTLVCISHCLQGLKN